MAENLAYDAPGSTFCENNPANGKKYGRLYDWETAKKAAPPGWHLPSKEEWQELVDFAGGKKIAGKKLKAKSGWKSKYLIISGNGTDEFGFATLPDGFGYPDGSFGNVGYIGYWWSATKYNADNAYNRYMLYTRNDFYSSNHDKDCLFSVRCVMD
jgi:uncharacterized protein (TIGR02145 family)